MAKATTSKSPLSRADVTAVTNAVRRQPIATAMLPVSAMAVADFATSMAATLGMDVSFEVTDPQVQEFIRTQGAIHVTNVTFTIRENLRRELLAGVKAGENAQKLRQRVHRTMAASRTRAKTIVRTEVGMASNYGANIGMQEAGVEQKEWLATQDGVVRASHAALDGTVIPFTEKFKSITGHSAPYPGAFGVPEEDINCRCAVIPVLGDSKKKPEPKPGGGAPPPPPPKPKPAAKPRRKPSSRAVGTRPTTSQPLATGGRAPGAVDLKEFGTLARDSYVGEDQINDLFAEVYGQMADAGYATTNDPPKLRAWELFTGGKPTNWAGVARQDLNRIGLHEDQIKALATVGMDSKKREAIRVVVHEVLHTQSPANLAQAYRGVGIPAEEALVEAQARIIAARIISASGKADLTWGAYQSWVGYTVKELKLHKYGMTDAERLKVLHRMFSARTNLDRGNVFKTITGKDFAPPGIPP